MKTLLIAILLLSLGGVSVADDMIPFTLDGVYMSVPVTFTGPKASISRSCWLDTAAQGFWVDFGTAEKLGYSMTIARNSGYTMPGFKLNRLQVGSKTWNSLDARAWTKLNADRCLIGMDMFWDTYTQFDFKNMVIVASKNPNDYWWSHWNACSETLRRAQNNYNACYQTARYAWERCLGPFPW